jgi:hypothetical protein
MQKLDVFVVDMFPMQSFGEKKVDGNVRDCVFLPKIAVNTLIPLGGRRTGHAVPVAF